MTGLEITVVVLTTIILLHIIDSAIIRNKNDKLKKELKVSEEELKRFRNDMLKGLPENKFLTNLKKDESELVHRLENGVKVSDNFLRKVDNSSPEAKKAFEKQLKLKEQEIN